jgi:hypothetical protein
MLFIFRTLQTFWPDFDTRITLEALSESTAGHHNNRQSLPIYVANGLT